MLKAEQFIDHNELARWTQSWDEDLYMDYFESQIQDRIKRFKVRSSMEENIVKVKKLCANMGQEMDFHAFLQLTNRIIFNCYFKQSNSALRIANFYEEIVVPADQPTRNRIFGHRQGYREIGSLDVFFQGQQVGQLGEQSDMFHLIFDASFLAEDELFDEDQFLLGEAPQSNPLLLQTGEEVLLTLKIWQPESLNMSLRHFVDLFLYHCSTQLGLNFKRASFDSPLERQQPPVQEKVEVREVRTEKLPLLYFNSASHHLPPAIVFMSYYHAMAYFFERAMNLVIREKMQNMFDAQDLEHPPHLRRMAKAVNTLKESFSEKEALGLILKRVVDLEALVPWLESESERKNWFTKVQDPYRELPILQVTSQKNLYRSLVERIYAIKASLAEELDKRELFVFQPNLDEELLKKEIPLIKHLAARTIEIWSVQDPV